MPDPALSAAIAEAYASAPVDQLVLHTLELHHPVFTTPIRVVRDRLPLDARLEATAPAHAGEIVTFTPYAFDLTPPDQTTTGSPQCVIEIDNVGLDILTQLRLAIREADPIQVIYRAYLDSDALDGPENDPPLRLELQQVSATPLRVRGIAGFPDLLNKAFPRLDYDVDTFPGLIA